MEYPRLVIAGTHSGSGKTTLSLALMALLARQGHDVRPFKVGPDYIDPAFHQAAAGRVSRNLDAWLLPEETLRDLFCRHAAGGDIALVEGVMGLYDGLGASARCSTAHTAALLEAPVLLVIDAGGSALSAAALVSGFASFSPHAGPDGAGVRLAGVICNRVSGPAHYALLKQGIEEHTGIPCLGWFAKNGLPALPHRHLGLVPAQEREGLQEYLARLADLAQESLDLPGLLAAAKQAPPLRALTVTPEPRHVATLRQPRVRIGVARDTAFSFYYQDNLEMLETLGADLFFFSPLRDRQIPSNLDGLYLGGGFPEVFAEALEANASFRYSLKNALERGLPAFAECGGMLYLCAALHSTPPGASEPRCFAMSGFFPLEAEMTARLQPFGYATATLLEDCLLGRAGDAFPAHEFHYSRLRESGGGTTEHGGSSPCIRMDKPGGRSWLGGLRRKNVLAIYPHMHFHGCPRAARSFIEACRNSGWREERT